MLRCNLSLKRLMVRLGTGPEIILSLTFAGFCLLVFNLLTTRASAREVACILALTAHQTLLLSRARQNGDVMTKQPG